MEKGRTIGQTRGRQMVKKAAGLKAKRHEEVTKAEPYKMEGCSGTVS